MKHTHDKVLKRMQTLHKRLEKEQRWFEDGDHYGDLDYTFTRLGWRLARRFLRLAAKYPGINLHDM